MSLFTHNRCKHMILGALVADAAAMGLHWIYDQPHIRKLAPEAPEFMPPLAKNYEGVPAYFAHPTLSAGAQSQYGVQSLVMLRALVDAGGRYDPATYTAAFRAHFGYGGAYVGYIDHATGDTLDNFRRFNDAAKACAQALPFDGEARVRNALVAKALEQIARHEGDELAEAYQATIAKDYKDSATRRFAAVLLPALAALPAATGASDLQLPAIAKLPPLVSLLVATDRASDSTFDAAVTSAIQITNDHPVAADYGRICAAMMQAALTKGSVTSVIDAGCAAAGNETATLLDEALEMRTRPNDQVTAHFGMACDLPFGVPSAFHNIATASSFTQAVRSNIYGGGDSCGRAMLVGAVMGAVHGVGGTRGIPPEWITRLEVKAEVEGLLAALFD